MSAVRVVLSRFSWKALPVVSRSTRMAVVAPIGEVLWANLCIHVSDLNFLGKLHNHGHVIVQYMFCRCGSEF